MIFIKFTPRLFLSRLTSSWPDCVFIALFFGPIPVALDWDNTSSSFPFFGFMSSDCSLGSLCGCVRVCLFQFLFYSSSLGLYVPYALLCFSLFHWCILNITYHCLMCCAGPFLSFPISDLTNIPLLVPNIYI